jgi:hypothetical protein
MNRHERRRAAKTESEVFILTPVNIETVLAAAEAGDECAHAALSCGEEFIESGTRHCLHCRNVKFTSDNPPFVMVVVRPLHNGEIDETRTAGFCAKCVENENFVPHLEKLGIKRAELFAQTLQ